MWGKGNTPVLLMGAHPGAATTEINVSTCRFLQNLEMDTPQDPAIAFLCYNHRKLTILCAHSSMFNVALFITARK